MAATKGRTASGRFRKGSGARAAKIAGGKSRKRSSTTRTRSRRV